MVEDSLSAQLLSLILEKFYFLLDPFVESSSLGSGRKL